MKLYLYNTQIYLSIDESQYHPNINMLNTEYKLCVGMKVFVLLHKRVIVLILPYTDELNNIFNNYIINNCHFYITTINDKLIY